MRLAYLTLLFLVVFAAIGRAQSERFSLVVHPSNPIESISPEEASRIFLKQVKTWPMGLPIEVVDQHADSKLRAIFSRAVHGRSVPAIKSHWHKKIFTGRGLPPTELKSDVEVIRFVSSHPGGIGYISSRTSTHTLKIVRLER